MTLNEIFCGIQESESGALKLVGVKNDVYKKFQRDMKEIKDKERRIRTDFTEKVSGLNKRFSE